MSEKDYYERLLNKMNNTSSNLNTTLENIDTLKTRLGESLKINEGTYRLSDINQLRQTVESKKGRIDNTIIPKIKDKIKDLEEEEKAKENEQKIGDV